MANPFTPSFGVSPPLLVGRTDLIEDFVAALEDGPGSPGRASLYTGARGTGKTVMLKAVEDEARALGWVVISETANPGFLDRIVREHLPALLAQIDPEGERTRMTGFSAPLGLGGASWQTEGTHEATPGIRSQLTLAADLLSETGSGVLVTIDEIHGGQVAEVREMAATLQHLFREGREVAFAGAGLPAAVSNLLNDEILTFLRRADRHSLGRVALTEVAAAVDETIRNFGRSITGEDAAKIAEATGGYPFMIQLAGYHVWRQNPEASEISPQDVEVGIAAARRRLGSLVHEPALADLSGVDRTFLFAMAMDEGPSKMSDIAQRLRVDANYASQYRLRLLAAELIESPAHGEVDFAMPYLRDYLREHAAHEAQLHLNAPRSIRSTGDVRGDIGPGA